MKKQHLLKSMLLLCALVVGSGSVWAIEVVHYSLEPVSTGTNTSPHNAYGEAATATISGIGWSVTGNSNMVPWRIGGKKITEVDRTVFSTTAMSSAITKVELEVGAASSITVNSLTLVVDDDSDFSSPSDEVEVTFKANSTLTFKPTSPKTEWATGSYYKFVFNVSVSVNSNKFVEFTSADFYKSVTSTTATINDTYKWATFSSPYALDFEGISTLSAYRASAVSTSSVTLTQVTGTCAANTGLLLNGATTNIPVVASGTSYSSSDNKLVAVSSATTLTSADKAYVLTVDGDDNVIFGKVGATDADIAAGQAYLDGTDIYANELTFDFGSGEVTGINEVKEQKTGFMGDFYNLAGQRVTRPGKGMYIVNGKKVIIK